MTVLKLEGLTKTFEGKKGNVNALSDINIEIEEGEIFGIIGMSGAGKSTLVRCINLLEKPTSGSVVFDGKELTTLKKKELAAERTKISMVFQQFNLLMQRTALKNVCFPLELQGVPKKEAEKNWEKLEQFVYSRPMIKAYFHGDKNYNEFYTWHGVNGTISLPVFRVDSPMKGEYSSDDERKLSFIVVTMDIDKRLLTARECLWNTKDQTSIQWGTTATITF